MADDGDRELQVFDFESSSRFLHTPATWLERENLTRVEENIMLQLHCNTIPRSECQLSGDEDPLSCFLINENSWASRFEERIEQVWYTSPNRSER